jgi:hypothetical protein
MITKIRMPYISISKLFQDFISEGVVISSEGNRGRDKTTKTQRAQRLGNSNQLVFSLRRRRRNQKDG